MYGRERERDIRELPVIGRTVGKALLHLTGKSQALVWMRGRRAGRILGRALYLLGGKALLCVYTQNVATSVCVHCESKCLY